MSGDAPLSLFERPVLVLDPGVHTAPIIRADIDAAGGIVVTGSHDRTVRLWSLEDGYLRRTIRLPQGPGNVGKVYAVAISSDGEWIAAGGWTRGVAGDEQIYLFSAVSGMLRQRIVGLPNVVHHLAFSPDGRRLAATLGGGEGLRLYDREAGCAEIACDADYDDDSYGVAFAPDGRLATTSYDDRLRLYSPDGALILGVEAGGARPSGLAFSPDGAKLAVGFGGSTDVRLFDGRTFDPLPAPDTAGIDAGDLSKIAWSVDGATLFAGGLHHESGIYQVIAWQRTGDGLRRELSAAANTIMSLLPLAGGDLLVAAGDPWLGRLGSDGMPRWVRETHQMDPRAQHGNLGLSTDGQVVDFGYKKWGEVRARFDVSTLTLTAGPPEDGRTAAPAQAGLEMTDWINSTAPKLDGATLSLELYEASRSLAIIPDGGFFVLGTDWFLRAFDAAGAELWRRDVPGIVWALNVSGDGRLAVAAYGDGTIRWHRMEDGAEILALFPLADRMNWVAWTPEGIYAATPGARGILRWHVNRGWDRAAEAIPASEIPGTFRPEVIRHVLPQMGTLGVIGVLGLENIRNAVRRTTGSDIAPGARLHVLAVGISGYGTAARHLDLSYADKDARDIVKALRNSQIGLYVEVRATCLVNEEATKTQIISGLEEIRKGMESGADDLAVIHFSGHGDMVDGDFYLLPHGIDDASDAAVKAHGLPLSQFHGEIAKIGRHGRVILLVDACRSGGATSLLGRSLQAMLNAANVKVLTSCGADQLSREDRAWENGAFTEALLEALDKADHDGDGLISVSNLSIYLDERVPALTGGAQRPEVETRGSDIRILARL